jgi:hypothetical protein
MSALDLFHRFGPKLMDEMTVPVQTAKMTEPQ